MKPSCDPALNELQVSLRICGDALEPETISRLLNALPTHAHRKGESRTGRMAGKTWPSGLWSLRAPEGQSLRTQLEYCFNLLESGQVESRPEFVGLRRDLFIGVFPTKSQCGFAVQSDLVERAARLGLAFTLDIYAIEEAESEIE